METSARWVAALVALALAASAGAAVTTYNVNLTGANEAAAGTAGGGDPDGSAIGTLTLNSGTGGATGSVTVNVALSNLDFPLAGFHIHTGGPTQTGAILIDFGQAETYRSGNLLSGTITNLNSTNISNVQANPGGFYFNIHNTPFPSGAVRDQVPEPTGLGALALGGLLLVRRTRRA